MDNEIKFPTMENPKFFEESYDYRNIENAGPFCGVGMAGKVGSKNPTSINPMPDSPNKRYVARDHKG